jgi:hypothetical protein
MNIQSISNAPSSMAQAEKICVNSSLLVVGVRLLRGKILPYPQAS